jgi:hypothetical protein
MKSLTAAHQPDRAYSILKKEMPRVGVKVTSVHYAIVMLKLASWEKYFRSRT